MNKLSFKLKVFEGPLDLLMHLIQKNKIDIYDIPISKITEQYMAYLEYIEEIDLELSSEFLVMAAQLLYIKSKMLLPKTDDPVDEEDPRQELVDRLLEYQRFKQISEIFGDRQFHFQQTFIKNPDNIEVFQDGDELIPLSSEDLIKAFNSIFVKKRRMAPPPKESFDSIIKHEKISIEDKIDEILLILSQRKKILFMALFDNLSFRPEIVARFLAILELIKANEIIVAQQAMNNEIYVIKK